MTSIAFLLCLTLTASWSYGKERLIIRVGESFPNYYQDENGDWQGVDVELARALVVRAGFEYEFRSIPWSRALVMAKEGQIDILANANITAERSEYLYWIGPERYTQLNLVVRKELLDMPINSLDDLVTQCKKNRGLFGYQRNVKYTPEFHRRLETDPEFAACLESVVQPLNDDKVLHQRLLGYFDEPFDIVLERKRDPQYALVVHPFVLLKEPVFIGVSKKGVNVDSLIKLFEAYESLLLDGTLEKIRSQWMQEG
ncbi:transporter substrate-binding domain-containing protein [Hahella sp. HN01]|uniref:substrate-binding periplasmic protein n=1 Tax=Hahella sp. HN01 TaxID=2847262 RepID=UPI001C1F00C5|nr:transporter substrate-binding domain-containing protein [Hahella sp. HN01]